MQQCNTYRAILKKFYKWLNNGEYPIQVKWMKNNINKRSLKLPGEGELLTERDIKRLIEVADHPRDKALLAVLYESGCRVGEVLNLYIKDVEFDKEGARMCVQGKTGMRKIRIIFSVPYLVTWLNNHPYNVKDLGSSQNQI